MPVCFARLGDSRNPGPCEQHAAIIALREAWVLFVARRKCGLRQKLKSLPVYSIHVMGCQEGATCSQSQHTSECIAV